MADLVIETRVPLRIHLTVIDGDPDDVVIRQVVVEKSPKLGRMCSPECIEVREDEDRGDAMDAARIAVTDPFLHWPEWQFVEPNGG